MKKTKQSSVVLRLLVTIEEGKKMGRQLCKICYGN